MKASASNRRGVSPLTLFLFLLFALLVGGVGTVGTLQATGQIDLPFFRHPKVNTHEGEVAVPISAQDIPAYAMVTRDHLLDPETGAVRVLWLKKENVRPDMITDISKIIGRVLQHEKHAGYAFRDKISDTPGHPGHSGDFLPEGTRPGLVAGIPAGKLSFTLDVNKIKGIQNLKAGDHFDLLATMPVDDRVASHLPENTHVVASPNVVVPQKRATVRVIARNGVLVSPKTVRLIPVTSESLFSGSTRGTKVVEEVVFALDPEEIPRLTEAMTIGAEVMCAARSGLPHDPKQYAETPELPPQALTVVETISGGKHQLMTFPLGDKQPQNAGASQGVVPAAAPATPKKTP